MSVVFRIMPVVLKSTAEGVWRCDCLQRIGECIPSNRGFAPGRTSDRLVIKCSEEGFDEVCGGGGWKMWRRC